MCKYPTVAYKAKIAKKCSKWKKSNQAAYGFFGVRYDVTIQPVNKGKNTWKTHPQLKY